MAAPRRPCSDVARRHWLALREVFDNSACCLARACVVCFREVCKYASDWCSRCVKEDERMRWGP